MKTTKKPSLLESTLNKIVERRENGKSSKASGSNLIAAHFDDEQKALVRELMFKSGLSLKALMIRGFNLQCEENGVKPLHHAADRRARG